MSLQLCIVISAAPANALEAINKGNVYESRSSSSRNALEDGGGPMVSPAGSLRGSDSEPLIPTGSGELAGIAVVISREVTFPIP